MSDPTEPSTTRKELEASIRALLPAKDDLSLDRLNQPSTVAAVGVASVLTGYAWGRFRGWRIRKHKHKNKKKKRR